ncbi:MAG TPA: aspartyl protease family protein [Steroidobacteraceae bacterium]|nr:aspartyl protease family protein [Steroidobacteraceae bacterium]
MNGWIRGIAGAGLLTFAAAGALAQAPGKADELLDAAKSATGGAAWDQVVTWHESGTVAAGGLSGRYQSWTDLTSLHDASQYSLGPSSGSAGWDGKRAWTTDSSGEVRVETSRETVAQAIQDAYRSGYAFYFPNRFPARREYAGTRTAEGKRYEAVKITPAGAEPFEVWLDPATHRVAREVQLTGGMPHTFIVSEFASFGDLQVPKKTVDRVGNNPKFDTVTQVSTIDFSGPQTLARYAPPPPPPNNAQWPRGKASVTVPFRLLNNHIYVMASIGGQEPIPFVFDTGATDILEASAAKRLGIAVEGALPGGGFGDQIAAFGFAKVKSVSLGGLTLPDQVFGTQTSPGWIAVEGAQSDGLLGYEFVKRAVLSIDYAKRTLTFTRQEAFHPPKDVTAIPFTFDEHIPMVTASLDGHTGEFEIDTGSRGALIVMHPFATSNALVDKYHATRLETIGYGVGGPSKALLARAGELTIGSTKITGPITELINDTSGQAAATHTAGNIGGDLLKRYTVTLDYAHQLLWLQPNELAGQAEVFDRAGVWIARAKDGAIEIADVANDSPAAKAGIATGDEILAVNGKPARDVQLYELRDEFKGAVGTPFKLRMKQKQGGERDVTVTLADQV